MAENYKGNSHKEKEQEEKKVERVAKGKVKKRSEVKKMADVFMAEDVTSVKDYIIMDVLLPAAKKAISDMVTSGIDMILYGETRSHGKDRDRGSRVSYTKYYDERDRRDSRRPAKVRSGYNFDDIYLETRFEAEEVLDRMEDLIDTYGLVSVADLNDLVGVQGSYTDNKYGWTNLRNASVQRTRDGYYLKLPKVIALD